MPYKQGDTATGPNGETIVFDGENWQDQPPSTLKDVGRSGLAGLGHGIAQLVGLPFSVADLAARGLGKLAENTVGEGMLTKGFENIRRDVAPIIGSKLEEYGNKAIPAMAYEPQTGWGQAAHTAGEWAPAILGGGAGALARGGLKAGATALTKGTTSALGSEGAGQLAHEYVPDWEPAARMIGALAGYRVPTTVGNIAGKITNPAPSAARVAAAEETPSWLASASKLPVALGTAYAARHGFGLAEPYDILAGLAGMETLPKAVQKVTGAAAKGAGIMGQELKQDPLTPAWLTAARAVPALEQESQ